MKIPKIRIGEQLFSANLQLRPSVAGDSLVFSIADIAALGAEAIADAFQATYNPENQQVIFPRVTVSSTGEAYSAILQYHAETTSSAAWLEVIEATLIK
ncbi:MAG: hypothetical protein P1P78_09070 [Methyloprofundus sp.]|nr:hypothetical protein [Methyloprofundus sp.]